MTSPYDFSGWGSSPSLRPQSQLLPALLPGDMTYSTAKAVESPYSFASNRGNPFGTSLNMPDTNTVRGSPLGGGMFGTQPISTPEGGVLGALGNWGGAGNDRGMFSSFLQQKYADGSTGGGYGSAGLGILQGLGSAYMGMKQYGLAKDSLNESKKQFNMNYAAQQKLTNSEMEDRQNRRMRENPNAMPTPEYMKKNGI